jgi:hypothetical protein
LTPAFRWQSLLPCPPRPSCGLVGGVDSNISFYQPIRGSAPDEIALTCRRRTPVKFFIFFLISFLTLRLNYALLLKLYHIKIEAINRNFGCLSGRQHGRDTRAPAW